MGLGAPDAPGAPGAALLSRMQGSPQAHKPTKTEGQGNKGSPAPPTDKTRQQGKSRSRLHSRSNKGTKERAGKKGASKPTKKGTPPPMGREQAALPLITNSRQKISKKSLGVVMKKFSEKFFVGMFRGKEKPLALSQRKGDDCLINLVMKIVK